MLFLLSRVKTFFLLDFSKSLILSDQLHVQKVHDIDQDIWLVSIFYLNVDILGGVPDFCVDKRELSTWCKAAGKLIDGNLRQITLSYNAIKEPAKLLPRFIPTMAPGSE